MGGVSSSLTLKDKFSNTLDKGTKGIDRMIKAMDRLGVKSISLNPGKLWSTAGTAINRTRGNLDDFIRRQDAAAKGAEKVKSSWGGVGGLIRGAMAAFGAKKIIGLTDAMTSTGARLNLMNDGSQTNDELSAKIMASAQRSRASYLDTASAIAKLGLNAKAAFSGNDETIAFMEQVNKLFVIGGASAQEQSNAMTQLTQAMAAGALRGEELNSILDAGPGIARAIEKYMGIAEGQIKSVAERGLVTADVVKNALFDAAETTNKQFESMPKTFGQVWTQISNFAIGKFSGVMERINAFLNSATGGQIIAGIMAGISILATGINGLFDLIERVGTSVMAMWDTIAPILQAAIPTAIGGIVGGLILWTINATKAAIATITAMSPIVLIGLAIGAVIGLIIYAAMKMGATFEQITGVIVGTLGGLYAFGYNLVADAWNLIATFGEFFANFLNNPIAAIHRLFVGLQDYILGVLETIANAIDAVFGSNLAGAINGFRDSIKNSVDDLWGEQKTTIDRMEKLDYANTVNQWSKAGENIGAGITDTFGKLFDGASDLLGGGAFGGSGGALPNIGSVGEIGKVKDAVNIAEEDLQLMKDVAEMRYVQNFVTLTPTVAQHIGTVNQNADVDYLVNETARVLMDEVAAEAEGYYN